MPTKGTMEKSKIIGHVNQIIVFRQSYDVTIDLRVEGTNQSSSNTLDLKNPYFRYTGAPVQPPPGVSNVSPSENYWSQLDAQGVRNGKICKCFCVSFISYYFWFNLALVKLSVDQYM